MATAAAVAGIIGTGVAIYDAFFKPEPTPLPPEPTIQEIIMAYLPQVLFVIIVIACVLMFIGIIKNYKKKVITFLYPILLSIIYFVLFAFSSITLLQYNLIVIAFAVDIILTCYYLYVAIQIFTGKKTSKKVFIKLDNVSNIK